MDSKESDVDFTIDLVKQTNKIPEMLEIRDGSRVHPFLAGEKLNWKAEV